MKADFYTTYHHADEKAARWIASELKQGNRSGTIKDFIRRQVDSVYTGRQESQASGDPGANGRLEISIKRLECDLK